MVEYVQYKSELHRYINILLGYNYYYYGSLLVVVRFQCTAADASWISEEWWRRKGGVDCNRIDVSAPANLVGGCFACHEFIHSVPRYRNCNKK